PVYFSDVLVADILISFSGVFTSVCVQLMRAADVPHAKYAPFITSIPYLIRLKQCLCDYYAQQHPHNSKLINALKYASSIPVIFLGHHTKPNSSAQVFHGITQGDLVWQLWLFSAIFNSAFAFAWDLIMDWGLVQTDATETTTRMRLRKDLYFSDPLYYIAAVGVNGSLRLLKIGSHVYHVHPICVDVAEIVRRWIWVVFRFENEWLKR
ncbi:EXS family-domain-containing protein, partial [Mucor lusitanicus]